MLAVKSNSGVALSKAQERYNFLQTLPGLDQRLNGTDKLIVANSTKKEIRAYTDQDLIDEVKELVKMISLDVGIQSVASAYTPARFMQVLQRHYNDLTTEDVKLAFELNVTGELDEYLPLDKNGRPDRNHYQSFNVQYYTKVLNAYKKRKQGTWAKANKHLARLNSTNELILTEDQKAANKEAILNQLYEAFDAFKNNGVQPRFIFKLFAELLADRGLIKYPKPTKSDYKKATENKLTDKYTLRIDKPALRQALENGTRLEIVEADAQRIANNRVIKKLFVSLVAKDQNIKSLF